MPPAATKQNRPRWVSPVSNKQMLDGDGEIYCEFIELFAKITKDTISGRAGSPMVMREWQKTLISQVLARRPDGRRKHRTALIGLPRKNGKSALGSAIALTELFTGGDGLEVYSCAAEREQARIVFGSAKRMVEMNPELLAQAKLYRDAIEIPSTGSTYRVLSAESYSKEGYSPSLVIMDELHVVNRDLYDVMQLGMGARVDPLMLCITTAGARVDMKGQDSLGYQLYQHGCQVSTKEVDDPNFFFAWWEPDDQEADHRDPKVWRECNPGIDDLVALEDFESVLPRTPESEFRTKRLNLWVVAQDAAFPHGAWEKCAAPKHVEDGTEIVLGFDGSYAGDSTALVGVTREETPHIFVIDAWERPLDDDAWRVNVGDVEEAIENACRKYQVREVACDPYRWQRSMQVLEERSIPIVEWPTGSLARMIPAWQKFYDAVLDEGVTHDDDARLNRHIANMVLKRDRRGMRPTKESTTSLRKIDLGIAAIIGFDRATFAGATPQPAITFI